MVTQPDTWTPTPVTTNRATNPGFETTTAPWVSTQPYSTKTNVLSALGIDPAAAFTGTNGMKLTLGASSSTALSWVSYDNPVGPYATIQAKAVPAAGHSTVFGFWALMPTQADGTVVPAAASSTPHGATFLLTTSWQQVDMTLVPAINWATTYPTATGSRLFLAFGGNGATEGTLAGDVVHLDMFTDANVAASFDGYTGAQWSPSGYAPIPQLTPGWDGEFQYAWTGTPYASTSTRTLTRKVHYPSTVVLGTPFLVEGAGYPAGAQVSVMEGQWGEIIETAVADSSGNWSVTMTVPANTDPDVGPVAGNTFLYISADTGGVVLPQPMTYVDTAPADPAPASSFEGRVYEGGTGIPLTEMRIVTGGSLVKVTAVNGAPGTVPPADPGSGGTDPTPVPIDPTPVPAPTNTAAGSLAVGSASYPVPGSGVIYVDSGSGSDSAAGTLAAPVKTFEKAASLVATGGTIVLRAGEYHEGRVGADSAYAGISLTTANVTVQNYPGEVVWFDGSSTITGWVADTTAKAGSTLYRKDNWTTGFDRSPTYTFGVADDTRPDWGFINPAYPAAAWPDQVFVDGTALEQVNDLSKVTTGKFFVDQSAQKLYMGTNPSGHTVRCSTLQTCLSMLAQNQVLRGIGFRRYAPSMPHTGTIKALRSGCTIENVWIEDMANGGLSTLAANTTVRNVTMKRCGNLGGNFFQSDNLVLDKVRAEECNSRHFNYSPSAGGVKIDKCRYITVKDSVFNNNYGKGLWFDESAFYFDVVSCDIIGNEERGVVTELAGHGRIVNTVIADNGYDGLVLMNNADMDLWNNTVVRNGRLSGAVTTFKDARNINFLSDDRAPMTSSAVGHDKRYPFPDPAGDWVPARLTMRNTVNTAISGQSIWGAETYGTPKVDWPAALTAADGNLYAWTIRPQYPWVVGRSTTTSIYSDLGSLKSGLGKESASTFYTATVVGDLNMVAPDYAAAHNAAVPLPADIAALVGQPTGTKHVGAWR